MWTWWFMRRPGHRRRVVDTCCRSIWSGRRPTWMSTALDVSSRRLIEWVSSTSCMSIVGLEKVRLPYARVKLAAEEQVRASTVPWSIVPATGFYWLWHRMFTKQLRLPVWVLPSLQLQPVDSDDFAEYVLECLTRGPGGDRVDFAGPETLTLVDFGRQFLSSRGERRPVVRIPVPERLSQAAGGLAESGARYGTTTWSEWLRGQHDEKVT